MTIMTTAEAQLQVVPQDQIGTTPESDQDESFTISSNDDERKLETQRQAWFENAIKKELKIPNSYVHVAPLIIRWDPEVDDYDPGHSEEVSGSCCAWPILRLFGTEADTDQIKDLNRVFNRFGFASSTEVRLNPKVRKPQHALNKAISEHIEAHDGKNKLMIIYYTGHGILDSDRKLLLAA